MTKKKYPKEYLDWQQEQRKLDNEKRETKKENDKNE